jgi:hypothetical protein
MKVLYDSAQVQQAIKRIFRMSKGRRVAITAFVGKNASAYLPNPDGIELVCWPKAGGTNPSAVRDLIARKVKVRFADDVHMKLYWTSDKGAVVTSANLSTQALGSGGLRDMGVWIPSSAIAINKVLGSLKARAVTESALDKLDAAHLAYSKINPAPKAISNVRSYAKWYASTPRSKWKIAWYYNQSVRLSRKAKGLLEKEHGSAEYNGLLATIENYAKERGEFGDLKGAPHVGI